MLLLAVNDSVAFPPAVFVIVAPAPWVIAPAEANALNVFIVTLVPALRKDWMSPLAIDALAAVGVNIPPVRVPPVVVPGAPLTIVMFVLACARSGKRPEPTKKANETRANRPIVNAKFWLFILHNRSSTGVG